MALNAKSVELKRRLESQAAKVAKAKTGAEIRREYKKFNALVLKYFEPLLPDLAAKGDHDGIRETLVNAAHAIKWGIPLPPKMAAFIASGLEDVANGKSHSSPFGLKYKRGQRADARLVRARHLNWTQLVEEARHFSREIGTKRTTVEADIAKVALEVGVSEEAIRSAWKKYRNVIRTLRTGKEHVKNSR